jgi:uncharacterized protein (UPF0264 family)
MISFARPAPGLIVSVRSPEEAEAALAGAADIIDVKEPAHGSLGRAADQTISAVLERASGRRSVSAALGEMIEALPHPRDPRLAFVKWGLAGCAKAIAGQGHWQSKLARELSRVGNPQTVVVAYADWVPAHAPALAEVAAFACQKPGNVLLIDTHGKEAVPPDSRRTLLDWLTLNEVKALCGQCHAAGVRIALAGSLNLADIAKLRTANPDWFAVRGAVCEEGNRQGAIDADKVRRLARMLDPAN